jgi:hypothetical protein
MDPELKTLIARNTDAVIHQSASSEKVAAVLERLEARLAIQDSAPIVDPKVLTAKLVVTAAVAALVASCTVLAWGVANAPSQSDQQQRRAGVAQNRAP